VDSHFLAEKPAGVRVSDKREGEGRGDTKDKKEGGGIKNEKKTRKKKTRVSE
jgi:hypothetical protein